MARSHKHGLAPSMVPGLGGYVARSVRKHITCQLTPILPGGMPARPRPRPPTMRPPAHARGLGRGVSGGSTCKPAPT